MSFVLSPKLVGRVIAVAVLAAPIAYFLLAAKPQAGGAADGTLPLAAPLPDKVPPGVTLTIGDPTTQKVLQYTGWDRALSFQVHWVRMTGGPAVTEAFHARALDVGAAADIPPIHAVWVGMPVRIIAIAQRRDPTLHPAWVMATGPRSGVASLDDLRGKRIAFSPGQVQGEVVLRTLREHGLSRADVTLVEMPSTGADVYINALVAGQVDAAPIANGVAARHYIENFGKDGAKLLRHGDFRDDLADLYVRTETLQDPAKAAALREYVEVWARAQAWMEDHPDQWARIYYQQDQGLSAADARYVIQASGVRDIPRDWGPAVVQQQGAIDLLARETGRKPFPASSLFDRRFESVASNAFAAASAHP
jgi:sulfonate transport system substrate-binding protein